jgi:hypothetical protein
MRSAVGTVEAYAHDAVGAYRAVRRWIAPSQFVSDKGRAWGLERESLTLRPHGGAAGAASDRSTLEPPSPCPCRAARPSV